MNVVPLFPAASSAPTERPNPTALPLRILVVDQDPAVVEALRIALSVEGVTLCGAGSSEAAIDAARSGEHDVALVDVRCLGGAASAARADLLAQLRAVDPTLPIVVMASWSEVEQAIGALWRGARDYLQKPWETSRLIATIRKEAAFAAALRRVRQLEAEVAHQRELLTAQGRQGGGQSEVVSLEEVEKAAIRRALASCHGNVVRAAVALGLSRSAMYRRLQAYGIRPAETLLEPPTPAQAARYPSAVADWKA